LRNGFFLAFLFCLQVPAFAQGSAECAPCHQSIWQTYQKTGMARSFTRVTPADLLEGSYQHKPSDSYFTMLRRDGKLYQRRHQLDAEGHETNVMEKRVDYIMGSGRNARAYISRTTRNTLVELPLARYSENGGSWAMNPGYDRPDHEGFRRTITYDCMFCHNAYPRIPAGNEQPFAEPVYTGELPQGIDCQRCHGQGKEHIRSGGRAAILNPKRLPADRQMEVCMQCHLETTSFPLPNALPRYERGPFSYKPDEPLSNFILSFDHAPGAEGRDDKFELVSAAYRLRKSQCFLKSDGKLTCTTCHNPHQASNSYDAICAQCHATISSASTHPSGQDCVTCHMPKRRAEDVVHAAVTDHLIQRTLPRDPLAPLTERQDNYRGEVVPYYPKAAINDLLLAVAQVIQRSNLELGISQLESAIARSAPQRAEYYLELAEAYQNNNQPAKALPLYQQAVRRNPNFLFGWQKLAAALRRSGRPVDALAALQKAAQISPDSPYTWREQGLAEQALGRPDNAITALERAIAIDPDMSEAYNNLGAIWSQRQDATRALGAFREAIRIQPDYADAHANLATLLSSTGGLPSALEHFALALKFHPKDAPTRYSFAMALGRSHRADEAQQQLEASLRDDPNFGDSHQLLADLLFAKGENAAALNYYREAVRLMPDSPQAHFGLAAALIATGDRASAIPHLQKAAAGPDAAIRDQAAEVLRQLGVR
jgi:tetratricopeptide (TPR) repeat protein